MQWPEDHAFYESITGLLRRASFGFERNPSIFHRGTSSGPGSKGFFVYVQTAEATRSELLV
jgi:hypothetical protein